MIILHQNTPYEKTTLEDYFGPEDSPDIAELYDADPLITKARKKAGAFAASFNALMSRAGIDEACEKADIDPSEVRRVYMVLLELATRAELQAESQGRPPTKVRHYFCPDWVAELTYRREVLPRDLSEEEQTRRKASLSRQWRRQWKKIHRVQCRSHLPLVERERGGLSASGKRRASAYVDHIADLLTRIAERAGQFRKGLPVVRYNRAADEVLADFREEATPYAPEWEPAANDEAQSTAPKQRKSENEDPPYINSLRRAVKLAKKEVEQAAPDESSARLTELHEWLDALWKDGGNPVPPEAVSPVSYNVDINPDSENGDLVRTPVSQLNDPESVKKPGKTQNPLGDGAASSPPNYSVEYDPEPEPRGQSLAEAEAALDAFVSVGAEDVVAVVVDDALPYGENKVDDDHLDVDKFRRALPYYLEHNLDNPTHSLCGRPRGPRRLIQVDDCALEVARLLLPFAFLAVMTSPGNFQVWVALSDAIPDDEEFRAQKRRLYKQLNPKADKKGPNGGAHGSIRWPGTLNRKPKRRYADGESPRVQLVGVTPGRTVSLAELDDAGLLAPPPRCATPEEVRELKVKLPSGGWPDINDYLSRAGDRSGPECGWAMAAFKRGFPRHAIISKLKEIGPKAKTRGDEYAEQTVAAAWNFLVEQSGERVVA